MGIGIAGVHGVLPFQEIHTACDDAMIPSQEKEVKIAVVMRKN